MVLKLLQLGEVLSPALLLSAPQFGCLYKLRHPFLSQAMQNVSGACVLPEVLCWNPARSPTGPTCLSLAPFDGPGGPRGHGPGVSVTAGVLPE